MKNKKLGLLLLPLVPLSAIGIVEIVDHVLAPEPMVVQPAKLEPTARPAPIALPTAPQAGADA